MRLHKLTDKPFALALILLLYLINGIFYLRAQSLTFDETSHLSYATRLLKGHTERVDQMDASKMPVSVLNLIPRIFSQLLNPGLKKTDYGASDAFAGRYITLLVSIFTILLVYYWTKEMYGYRAGLFSAFLISVCPNMIANSGLVTTDSYSMLLLALTFYSLWKFCTIPGIKHFIFFSLCVAVSQLVKQSLFHLYILLPIVLAVYYFIYKPGIKLIDFFSYLILFFFINWMVINLGYGFQETNTELSNFHFFSSHLYSYKEHFLIGCRFRCPKLLLPAWIFPNITIRWEVVTTLKARLPILPYWAGLPEEEVSGIITLYHCFLKLRSPVFSLCSPERY